MVDNPSRPAGIIPTLYYDDVGAAVEWLLGAFGFVELFRYGPADSLGGAQLQAGDGTVMLGVSRTGQSPEWDGRDQLGPPRAREGSVSMSIHVDDVDEVYARAKAFGARILRGPQTYPFGERQFTAQDPAGFRWSFSQSVDAVAPEAWGADASRAPRT